MNWQKYIVVKVGHFMGPGAEPSYQIYVNRGEYFEATNAFENGPVTREVALKKCAEANTKLYERDL